MFRDISSDVRYAARVARRAPWLTTAVVLTMTLGIGVATSAFSIVRGVLVKPLPFTQSDQVVRFGVEFSNGERTDYTVYADLLDYRRDIRAYADIAAFMGGSAVVGHGDRPQVAATITVDEGFQRIFSYAVVHGRLFEPEDFRAGAPRIAILTHQFWSRLGADSGIIGRLLPINDVPTRVVGVLASGTYLYPQQDLALLFPLYVPPSDGLMGRMCHCVGAVGKSVGGYPLDRLRTETEAVGRRIVQEEGARKAPTIPVVRPLREAVVGPANAMIWLLVAAVSAVMLIGCINVANLLLGRTQARAREFAVRSAIGGSARRVVRQVLTESLFVAVLGAIPGVLLAPLLIRAFLALYPAGLPRAAEITVNLPIVLAAVAMTFMAGLLAGVPTARRAASPDLARGLREGERSGVTRGHRRVWQIMIVSQVALSVALLFAAGSLVQTLVRLSRVDPGFETRGLLTFRASAPTSRYADLSAVTRFYSDLRLSIGALPGVAAVGSGSYLPFGGGTFVDTYYSEDVGDRGAANSTAFISRVDEGFANALGLGLLSGRMFDARDVAEAPRVAIINETVARAAFPGVDPIGRFISTGGTRNVQVIGVARNIRTRTLWDDPEPQLFLPAAQVGLRGRYVVVRAAGEIGALRGAIERELRRIDPQMPMTSVNTMDDLLSAVVSPQRFRATMVGVLGAVAWLLALLGIYSIVAFAVSRQTREIGIRVALGEQRWQVRRGVVSRALILTLFGALAGTVLVWAERIWIEPFLIGGANNLLWLLASVGALMLAAGFAAYIPARRASRVDPVIALRSE